MKFINGVLVVVIMAMGLFVATPASASTSDSPVPYTLDAQGLTLPNSDTFPAHGHVNIRYLDPAGNEQSKGIHFDPNNNQPGGKWIGRNYIPWSAFSSDIMCITWVQIHGYNEHYGEGGQEPYCISKPPTERPDDIKEYKVDEVPNCEERITNWTKYERVGKPTEYDYHKAEWVFTWSDWKVVETGFNNGVEDCSPIPPVGSETALWLLLAGTALLTAGGVTYRVSRKS